MGIAGVTTSACWRRLAHGPVCSALTPPLQTLFIRSLRIIPHYLPHLTSGVGSFIFMPSAWCPAARKGQGTLLRDLPNELLFMILDYLGDRHEKWNLALGVPQIPQLMLPLLRDCKLRASSCQHRGTVENINTILLFLHTYPQYAREIRSISYQYHSCIQSDYRRGNICDCPIRSSLRPKFEELAKTACLHSNQDFMTPLMSGSQLSNFALLLALSIKAHDIDFQIESQSWCDLQLIAEHAFLPIANLFRNQGRTIQNLRLSKTANSKGCSMFNRNLRPLISTVLTMAPLKSLIMSNFIESVCHQGQWPDESPSIALDKISITKCRYRLNFVPGLLRQATGLTSFECDTFDHLNELDPESYRKDAGYSAFVTGLWHHKDTLENLSITLPICLEDGPHQNRYHHITQRAPLGSLKDFHRLKRLEISPCILGSLFRHVPVRLEIAHLHQQLSLTEILPSSLHNLILADMTGGALRQLDIFATYLETTKKESFLNLAHIVDLTNTISQHGRLHRHDVYTRIRPGFFEQLQRIGIDTYPGRGNFGKVSLWGPGRNMSWDSTRVRLEPSPESRCMGECSSQMLP